MLALELRDEHGQRLEPSLVGHSEAQRLVHPRAHADDPALRDGVFRRSDEVRINRRREALLEAHKIMLPLCHEPATMTYRPSP